MLSDKALTKQERDRFTHLFFKKRPSEAEYDEMIELMRRSKIPAPDRQNIDD